MQAFQLFAERDSDASQIPSMTTPTERALYRDIATNYQGRGEVIEVGPWLGGTTEQICKGLQESCHSWRLKVVDRFVWTSAYERKAQLGLPDGADFAPILATNLHSFAPTLDLLRSTVLELPSVDPAGGPIELLFVDAPKTWKTMAQLLRHYGPRLLPGSTLVLQDFLHFPSHEIAWLALWLDRLEAKMLVADGSTAAFHVAAPLGSEIPKDINELTASQLTSVWRRLQRVVPANRIHGLHVAMAGLMWQCGQLGSARDHLHSITYPLDTLTDLRRQIDVAYAGATTKRRQMYDFVIRELLG